jgi:UDP-N-acetylmuramyl tripeptide synthase
MFLLFVHIIRLFYRQVCFISKWLVGVEINKICSRHDIAEDTNANGAIRIRISKNRQNKRNIKQIKPKISYILVEKRNCALLKNQLKIDIKIKFINCVQYNVE